MSVLTAVGILVLAMLIMASLQLVPGIFALFSHYVAGKYPRSRATDLSTFFILGVETSVVVIFFCTYAILCCSPAVTFIVDSDIFAWTMAGIFIALTLGILGFYFRKGPGTKLFISRRLASNFNAKVIATKTRSDAFTLGLTASVPELIFTLPIYLMAAISIMRLDSTPLERAGIILLFAIVSVFPLIIIHHLSNHNFADFIKFRFKNKAFFRFVLALFYLFIAALIILGVTA
ncbi:MAG: hypothetical protein K6G49_02735 [Candidatus Saccharibacteria bacterium]|nr:hypothetical protein [Candidatus Saccharibacteria bacterium]